VIIYIDYKGATETFCGVLCHFDSMDGSEVKSALGPNFVPTSPAALDYNSIRESQFGAGSGNCGDRGDFIATGIDCPLNLSWRAEGWFLHTTSQGSMFDLGGSDGSWQSNVSMIKGSTNVVLSYHGPLGFMSEATGQFSPTVDEWFHAAVQYCCDPNHADYHKLYWFANGVRQDVFSGGTSQDYFGDSTIFDRILVGGNATAVDEFRFKTGLTNAELYGDTYTVPTSAFSPAD
jgi:hypothetical protein